MIASRMVTLNPLLTHQERSRFRVTDRTKVGQKVDLGARKVAKKVKKVGQKGLLEEKKAVDQTVV